MFFSSVIGGLLFSWLEQSHEMEKCQTKLSLLRACHRKFTTDLWSAIFNATAADTGQDYWNFGVPFADVGAAIDSGQFQFQDQSRCALGSDEIILFIWTNTCLHVIFMFNLLSIRAQSHWKIDLDLILVSVSLILYADSTWKLLAIVGQSFDGMRWFASDFHI